MAMVLPDVVVIRGRDNGGSISLFLNDPTHPGQLQPEQIVATSTGFFDSAILADMNGDGILDIAVSTDSAVSGSVFWNVGIFFGDPVHPGKFLRAANLNLGLANVYTPLVADFNQDGLNDLAVLTATNGASIVSIFFADPLHPGQFIAGGTYSTSSGDVAELLGDFNGDGLPEIRPGVLCSSTSRLTPGVSQASLQMNLPALSMPDLWWLISMATAPLT